jgi:histidine triad (HIT) family protein
MLSEEETEKVKQKLVSHIESTFPNDQKQSAISQVTAMDAEQLETFLQKNKLIREDAGSDSGSDECVFCSIINEKIKSVKLAENEKTIAVLDINPISKGHCLAIPRKHGEAGKEIMDFAGKLAKKLEEKLSPRRIEFSRSKLFGHETISILPVYSDESFKSERNTANIEELEKLKEELEVKKLKAPKAKKTVKTITEKIKEKLWLPKRIP